MVTARTLDGFTLKEISTFRLTFHISHPTTSAIEIENRFDLSTQLSQSVGEERRTKSGKQLEGRYKLTNVIFRLHENPLEFSTYSVEEFLKAQIESYDIDYIAELNMSGGSCDFSLGVFSSGNVMFVLSHEVLSVLSTARISIKYDFYGGE